MTLVPDTFTDAVNTLLETVSEEEGNITRTESADFRRDDTTLSVSIEVSKKDDNRWGEDTYAVDLIVNMDVENETAWSNLEAGTVRQIEKVIQKMIQDSGVYSGPVIVRENADPTNKSWSRRILTENPVDS